MSDERLTVYEKPTCTTCRKLFALLTLALAALFVAGCGGSSGHTQAATTAAPAPPTTTAATTPATSGHQTAPPAPVAAKKRRLAAAGYKVIVSGVEGVKPRPAGALEFPLKGGGQVTVYAYRSAADARAKAAQYRHLADRYPAYFRLAVRGATTYFGSAEQPEKLDVKGFDAAVARAEG